MSGALGNIRREPVRPLPLALGSKLANLALAWRCCLALFLACPPAWAADPPALAAIAARREAKTVFERGKALWAEGKLPEALLEFERAYQLSPDVPVLYYVGAVSLELEQWARARRAFELYLELGSTSLNPSQVEDARGHLEETNQHTATLTLSVNVPGAQVQVDGASVEPTTISNLVLDAGEHVVRVSKPGFHPLEHIVRAAKGESLHLVLPLAPNSSALDENTMPTTPGHFRARGQVRDAARAETSTPWLAWTVTGALATGWLATAGLAAKAGNDREAIERPGTSAARIDSARRLHIALAVTSDVLLASALASAGVSAYLTWWSEPALPDPPSQPARNSPASGGPVLTVSGRF